MKSSKLIWVLALIFTVGVHRKVVAQSLLRADNLCLFDTTTHSDALYLFNSDITTESQIDSLVSLAGLDRNFVISAANISAPAAAITSPNRALLYSQDAFQEPENRRVTNWENLTVLCHQLGHLLLRHSLSYAPTERRREELEADRFAGTLVHAFGGTLEQAEGAYKKLSPKTSHLYPRRDERLAMVREGWRALGDKLVTNFATEDAVPKFPLPPPRPSAWKELPLNKLKISHGQTPPVTIGELSIRLQRAFEHAGYEQISFYSVAPQGFAMLTSVEQVGEDGSPKAGPGRFSVKLDAPRIFSISSYLKSLLGPASGHFRIIAVVVSPVPLTYSQDSTSLRHSIDWLWGGMTRLPEAIARRPLTSEYSCTILIYEFTQPSAFTEAVLNIPSSVTAQEHLIKGGLWKDLQF